MDSSKRRDETIDLRTMRVRVGDPASPIYPGDYSPGGGTYRRGQFAPTLDELATLSLTQAGEAGLINKALPIFEGDKVDEKKLQKWDPNDEIRGVHFQYDVPKYSSAVMVDAFMGMRNLLNGMGFRYIVAGDREEQDALTIKGEVIVAAEYSSKGRDFQGRLKAYPSFYKYVGVPLVGKMPGRTTGLSIATYAVYHSVGHLLFSRLSFDGKLNLIGDYLGTSKWSKFASDNTMSGSFMGVQNRSVWRRVSSNKSPSEASRYSPMDDFAEAFAMYFCNRDYLTRASENRLESMEKTLREYGHVL